MKYALLNNTKMEAESGLTGKCPFCGANVIPKCGDIRIHHWAHISETNCDKWWESETEWHRDWKNYFPIEWQEVIHHDENGERHIADVKTSEDWIIEFQHSYINSAERNIRSNFYKNILWIVDGTRRKNDFKQFRKLVSSGRKIGIHNPIYKVTFPDECRIISEWENEKYYTLLDFNEKFEQIGCVLWLVFPLINKGEIYVKMIQKLLLIEIIKTGRLNQFINGVLHEEIECLKEIKRMGLNTNTVNLFLSEKEKQLMQIQKEK